MANISLAQARVYLDALDLNYLIDAMCSQHYFLPRWQTEEAARACQLYKNFLWLNKKYPQTPLVPSREIDEVWHNHILHTEQYVRDCENIFGSYLHHRPSSPEENPQQLAQQYLRTKELYQKEFATDLALIK